MSRIEETLLCHFKKLPNKTKKAEVVVVTLSDSLPKSYYYISVLKRHQLQ